ncbi:MAG: winged helix-turn-helix transcriptional regulator [Candidatus Bathyarchaeota archaeon]|nr:winged helix-turn-helix transcriptional regulator [Candidatus Bathyarchaeota archaeon]
MDSLEEIKTEFAQIYEDMLRAKGLPTIFGRIMATLLLEGRELSHKEISNLTGYSISSVSRTLDQMIRMGIVHKHKDTSLKHFVFHVSVDFPEMIASSMETMLRVYEAQRDEIKKLTRKVRSLKSKEKENVEINRLHATLENVEKTIGFAEGIMKNTIKELRSRS